MKKKILLLAVIILGLSLTGCDLLSVDDTTTEDAVVVDTDTYIEINSVTDLQNMEMNKSYILMSDLDLTGIEWEPIGSYNDPYLGNFNGNNNEISNLTITDDDALCNGLFGSISGDVWDLELTNVSITYTTSFLTYAGGLAGFAIGDINNVIVSGNISVTSNQSNTYAGLLVGYTQGSLEGVVEASDFAQNVISNSSVSGSLTVVSKNIAFVGGMIGKTFNTQVEDNYSNVIIDVTLTDYLGYIGGLIGHNYGGILVGFEDEVDDVNIYITNNVSFSDISVTIYGEDVSVGGLVGFNQYGYVSDNYSETIISLEGNGLNTATLSVGAAFGQNWHSEVIDNVVLEDLNNNITDEHTVLNDTNLLIIGYNTSDKEFSGNKYYVGSEVSEDGINEGVEIITLENTNDEDFYTNTMEWDAEQITKILE